jgi:hypothetical protein
MTDAGKTAEHTSEIAQHVGVLVDDAGRASTGLAHARIGWTQAAIWLRTDAARLAFVDAGAMSISYADRQIVANVLEAALSRCAEGTPMDVFNQAVTKPRDP